MRTGAASTNSIHKGNSIPSHKTNSVNCYLFIWSLPIRVREIRAVRYAAVPHSQTKVPVLLNFLSSNDHKSPRRSSRHSDRSNSKSTSAQLLLRLQMETHLKPPQFLGQMSMVLIVF